MKILSEVQDYCGRRNFLKTLSIGSFGLAMGTAFRPRNVIAANAKDSQVGFVPGNDRRECVYQALKPFKNEVEKAIQDKQVIIKVNMGQVEGPLNATHPDAVRGVLDFLKPIYNKRVIVAESTAGMGKSTLEGFHNFNYMPMEKEYSIKFVDLNDEPTTTEWIINEKGYPIPINIINTFLDPNSYMISVTRLKTHNAVVATLSLKNVIMASPIHHYKQKTNEGRCEKVYMHSGGCKGLSYNIFLLADKGVRPKLAVLDGVEGMEGDGPVDGTPWNKAWGTPIEHGVTLAGTDWLAVDRVGVELMGINYSNVMYLRWCGRAGMGQDDLSKISVVGPDIKDHILKYKLHSNIEEQVSWIEKS